MKGLILAGGTGSRLIPLTTVISKQLLPVYNKPMIFYPLTTLMLAGIQDIGIICNPTDLNSYRSLLGNGDEIGVRFTYLVQEKPLGIAHSIIVGSDFLDESSFALILGDNIFYGPGLGRKLSSFNDLSGAHSFAYQVKDPNNYGVVEFDKNGGVISLEEKPLNQKSNFAITGLYFFDKSAKEKVLNLVPSTRGELEIVDLLKDYLKNNQLQISILPRGTAWLDTGTFQTLHDASSYIKITEERSGLSIGDPVQVASIMGWIN
jgi:glucose-1-phosphate thymidylyltransferase